MHETIVCPGCQSQLMLPSTPAGQTVQCPRCTHVFEPFPQRARAAPTPSGADLYDDEADGFDPSTARMVRPEPLVGEWKATVAMFALAVSVLSFMVQVYVGYERIELIETQLKLGEEDPGLRFGIRRVIQVNEDRLEQFRERRERWERIAKFATLFEYLTYASAGLFFLIWLHQATATARILQAEGFSHTPGNAVISCCIPFMNLLWPHYIMQNVWCASDPQAVGTARSWATVTRSLLIRAWWFFCLAFIGLTVISQFMGSAGHDFDGGDPLATSLTTNDQ